MIYQLLKYLDCQGNLKDSFVARKDRNITTIIQLILQFRKFWSNSTVCVNSPPERSPKFSVRAHETLVLLEILQWRTLKFGVQTLHSIPSICDETSQWGLLPMTSKHISNDGNFITKSENRVRLLGGSRASLASVTGSRQSSLGTPQSIFELSVRFVAAVAKHDLQDTSIKGRSCIGFLFNFFRLFFFKNLSIFILFETVRCILNYSSTFAKKDANMRNDFL